MGFLPFCQLHQAIGQPLRTYDDRWRRVHRKWARPAAYRSRAPSAAEELFAMEAG